MERAERVGDETRRIWLGISRRLIVALVQRRSVEQYRLCPEAYDKPDRASLVKYAKLRAAISKMAVEQADFEVQHQKIGVLALLGEEPQAPVRLALTLLVARALSAEYGGRIGYVSDLCEQAVGTSEPMDLVCVRQAFARGGILRTFTTMKMGMSLDQCSRVSLRERSVVTMLGLGLPAESVVEFDLLLEGGLSK